MLFLDFQRNDQVFFSTYVYLSEGISTGTTGITTDNETLDNLTRVRRNDSSDLSDQSDSHFYTRISRNLQNYWVFGLFPSSGILETRKHDVSETGSVFDLK
jgi:hypothetical protein